MYNEESHCVRVIEDMCKVHWPRDRLLIQVRGGREEGGRGLSPSSLLAHTGTACCPVMPSHPSMHPHTPSTHPPLPLIRPLHSPPPSTQACDDSTRKDLSDLIDATAERMRAEGHPVSREALLHGHMGAWVHGSAGD